MTQIYVGRWDLLPQNWDGINTVCACTKEQLEHEMNRELDACIEKNGKEDNFIGIYDANEFMDTFNQTLTEHFNSEKYWIRIFED